jgi:hypothetical protein
MPKSVFQKLAEVEEANSDDEPEGEYSQSIPEHLHKSENVPEPPLASSLARRIKKGSAPKILNKAFQETSASPCGCDQHGCSADHGCEPSDGGVNAMVVEVVKPTNNEVNMAEVPKYQNLTIILDSGAGAHVMNPKDCKGHPIKESDMMRVGAAFKAANGTTIRNHGQVELNILVKDSKGQKRPITSKFEAADVTKALWSVGLICDCGFDAQFDAKQARIKDADGKEIMVFTRVNGGLYTADVEIANPAHPDFRRRGA